MGTRSQIMYEESEGVYKSIGVHWDGYPSGVGSAILRNYHEAFKDDREALVNFLFKSHPAGFSGLAGADWSLECGFGLEGEHPTCYCHGERAETDWTEPYITKLSLIVDENGERYESGEGESHMDWPEYAYIIGESGLWCMETRYRFDANTRKGIMVPTASQHIPWKTTVDQIDWESVATESEVEITT